MKHTFTPCRKSLKKRLHNLCIPFLSRFFQDSPSVREKKDFTSSPAQTAILILEQNSAEEAEQRFEFLINKFPEKSIGYEGLALLAQNNKKWNQAIYHWENCLKKTKNVPAWWLVKIAEAYFQSGNYDKAEKFFNRFKEAQPNKLWGYLGLLNIAVEKGDVIVQLQILETIKDIFPDCLQHKIHYGRILYQTNQFDDAENLFQQLLKEHPGDERILLSLAIIATNSNKHDLAAVRWKELVELFPEKTLHKQQHVIKLLDLLEFDNAQAVYNRYITKDTSPELLALQAKIHRESYEIEKAVKVITELSEKYPDNKRLLFQRIHYLTTQTRVSHDISHGQHALELLETFLKENGPDQPLQEELIKLQVFLGQTSQALQSLEQLAFNESQNSLELQAWAAYMRGKVDESKNIWHKMNQIYHLPPTQPPQEGTLQQVDKKNIKTEAEEILLFTVVRNERWRLPWFLNYYRSLGVNRFFFVDNDSSDGTSSFLTAQEDVYLFWTNASYSEARSGMRWINSLIELYGTNCWCIYVDVDEALIFPGVEKRRLQELTTYMRKNGHEAFSAFMLDMFSPEFESTQKGEAYYDFFADYPLFHNDYFISYTISCPYQHITGGIRNSLFKQFENQKKTPVIRGGSGIKYLLSSHLISPAILSDVTGALLHFKLAGDFKSAFQQDVINSTRAAHCKRRHLGYLKTLEAKQSANKHRDTNTVSYQSSAQLVELGLINTSQTFEGYNTD